ncbi:MAG: YjbQ family protein [Chloroflexi bacterium]|nr:YjbQ family protein [Chloroflexota bacterium]
MIVTAEINLQTKGHCDIIDITAQVAKHVGKVGIANGTVTVFVTGSTAGVTTIEFEPGLLADFKAMWERLAPQDIPYDHNQRWQDGNGFSHVRASFLGASLVVPFTDKKLALGTWQQIVLVDFDNRHRSRQIIVQVMGE